MKIRYLLLLISLSIILTSCYGFRCNDGLGEVVSTQFSYDNFNSIVVEGGADIFVQQSDDFKVILETNEDLIEYIEIREEQGKLIIGSENNVCPQVLNVYLQMPELEGLIVKGSGNIVIKDEFEAESTIISIDGSGDMILNLKLMELDISINGSGDVELIGEAEEVSCNINGSGDIDMEFFETAKCKISINGSGNVLVNVRDYLNVAIFGSGDVYYSGDPQIKQTVNGSGDIRKIKSN